MSQIYDYIRWCVHTPRLALHAVTCHLRERSLLHFGQRLHCVISRFSSSSALHTVHSTSLLTPPTSNHFTTNIRFLSRQPSPPHPRDVAVTLAAALTFSLLSHHDDDGSVRYTTRPPSSPCGGCGCRRRDCPSLAVNLRGRGSAEAALGGRIRCIVWFGCFCGTIFSLARIHLEGALHSASSSRDFSF